MELGPWFVKYGGHGTLEFEFKTHEYLFSQTFGDPSAPRIPRIVAYFTPQQEWAYLVTERIDSITPADAAPEAVAEALQWLRRVPRPSGLTLGSVGGGLALHEIFKDFKAPIPFSSAKALQIYMNQALHRIRPKSRPAEMHYLDDPLIFTQSDMDSSNFALDKNKRICMFDFRDVGVLPESFASYTLGGSLDPFINNVAGYLGWIDDRNRNSVARAGAVLKTSSDATLGTSAPTSNKIRTDTVDRSRYARHSQGLILACVCLCGFATLHADSVSQSMPGTTS